MIKELDDVILTTDISEHHLVAGDIGTVVLVHQGGAGFEVEFTAMDGSTIAVVTLNSNQIRATQKEEIAHSRQIA